MPSQSPANRPTLTIAGADVARIGLGTNRIRSENADFLREAAAAGLGLIDTAHVYTDGESERVIGESISPKSGGLVIATKGGYKETRSLDELRAQIEQSLASLRTDSIDLYYLHRVLPEISLEEGLGVIAEYRDAGKIREVGISAVSAEQVEAAREIVPIAAVQNHYNLEERGSDDVVDYCEENEIAFFPYYPLKMAAPPGMAEIAERHGATNSQIALAWLLRRSPAMFPIPGTRSIEHLRENLGALEIDLSDEEFATLA
jgi:aryl-alcohol dehydrogenase-like predicted oxidoreductase